VEFSSSLESSKNLSRGKIVGKLISFCILKNKTIFSARVYEEEDFQAGLYNFNLCNDLSDQKVVAMLKDCENDLQKQLREIDSTNSKFEDLNAVFIRVKFERLILQSLLLLYPAKSLSPNEMEMAEISKLLSSASDLMAGIKRTVCKGTQPDPESML
jgi:hypothetical protein